MQMRDGPSSVGQWAASLADAIVAQYVVVAVVVVVALLP
jgi:hypothetical protein